MIVALVAVGGVYASWYWPFGSDEAETPEGPRLSELMEPALLAIEKAVDLSDDGNVDGAIDAYREALDALDRIEAEYPDRAATPEFASVRNKRAYVTSTIDSLLMKQASENSKPVAVSDTTELEKKFAARRQTYGVSSETPTAQTKKADETGAAVTVNVARERSNVSRNPVELRRDLRSAARCIGSGEFEEAERLLERLLRENPQHVSALNLKAVCDAAAGDYAAASAALEKAIDASPTDYHAYYNMAKLLLRTGRSPSEARRYYEDGLDVGGPEQAALEQAISEAEAKKASRGRAR